LDVGEAERTAILVAEDDPSIRALILATLRRFGYAALSAADGRDALQLLEVEGRRIDLLLSDVMMPVIGGVELAAAARATRPNLPIILITAYGHWQLPYDATGEDITILEKPFTARRLMGAIQERLGEG
jgi:two-component system, cell cycle sensor histidine kinase and response regulator CckA